MRVSRYCYRGQDFERDDLKVSFEKYVNDDLVEIITEY